MEITNEIKAKVFAQYLGQKVLTPDGEAKLTEVCNIMFAGKVRVHFGANQIHTKNSLDGFDKVRNYGEYFINSKKYSGIKSNEIEFEMPGGVVLLLNPLSSITDEDAIEVGRIIINQRNLENGKAFCKRMHDKKSVPFGMHPLNTFLAFQFLQSRGYDLPHYLLNGKTLIEAGLAIDINTLNK